jgi:CubicO group peptidase (beta-lactamase class C family)
MRGSMSRNIAVSLFALPLLGAAVPGRAIAQTPAAPAAKAAAVAPQPADQMPVGAARQGFTPAQAADLLKRFNNEEALKGGDVSLFGYSNFSEVQRTAVIARNGPVVMLDRKIDPRIGQVRFKGDLGDLTLSDYLAHPKSRAQGFVVVHKGRIVFEDYPGMKPNDYHIWMSTTKTVASLMLRLLAEDGKVDVQQPLTTYLPWLRGSEWQDVKVIDALDMATGMAAIENDATRADPDSTYTRMNLAGSGVPHKGKVETMKEVLASTKRIGAPGVAFEYGSPITLLLPLIVEEVTGRRWVDLFEERVWGKMSVEGDMLMGVTPDGLALAHGVAITRLRDLARYGMLYTPSWNKAARERIVSPAYLAELQKGGNPQAFKAGDNVERNTKRFGDAPVSNHWQWDAVFADGDLWKSGFQGQGLYVSPKRDLVVAFFSTTYNDLPGYARAIAKTLPPGR